MALCSPPSVRSARLQQSSAAAYSPALYAFCALVSRLFSEDIAVLPRASRRMPEDLRGVQIEELAHLAVF